MTFMFLWISIIFSSYYIVVKSQPIIIQWKNCTTPNAFGNIENITIEPNLPSLGENWTIYNIGETNINLGYDGIYNMEVSAMNGVSLGTINGNLCNDSYLDLNAGYGRMYYLKHTCPINKGNLQIKQIGWMNPNVPYGLMAKAIFTVYYQNNSAPIFCAEVDWHFDH
eukprot:95768_1